MDLIVDSNIIVPDPMMSSPIWQALWAHLVASGGKLLVPEVVKKECVRKYLERCEKLREKIGASASQLGLLIGRDIEIELPDSGADEPAYHSRWDALVAEGRVEFLRNPGDGCIEDLQNRAIARLPPFDVNGNGFRDGTIWLSVRDHVKALNSDTAFISNDRRAYCSRDSGDMLHPHLQSEIGGTQLSFFTDIGKYLEAMAKKVPVAEFLTDEAR